MIMTHLNVFCALEMKIIIKLRISVSVALHLDEDFPDGKSNLMNGRKSGAVKRSVSSRGKGSRRGEHHWMQFNWKSGQAAIFEIEDAACYDARPSFDRESFYEKDFLVNIYFPLCREKSLEGQVTNESITF